MPARQSSSIELHEAGTLGFDPNVPAILERRGRHGSIDHRIRTRRSGVNVTQPTDPLIRSIAWVFSQAWLCYPLMRVLDRTFLRLSYMRQPLNPDWIRAMAEKGMMETPCMC